MNEPNKQEEQKAIQIYTVEVKLKGYKKMMRQIDKLSKKAEELNEALEKLKEKAGCLAQPADEFSRRVAEHLKEYVQRQQ